MKKISYIFGLIFLLFSFNLNAQEDKPPQYGISLDKIDPARFLNVAIIQILDKTTAKSKDIEIRIGESVEYGNILIKVNKCWQAPLDQKPDSRILMEVYEKTPITTKDEEKKQDHKIFHGWMIASSPSVSGLEHPVYDITALNCKK